MASARRRVDCLFCCLRGNRVAHEVRPVALLVEKDPGRFIAGGLLDEYVLILALEAGSGNGVRVPISMGFTCLSQLDFHQFGPARQALNF